MKRSSVPAAVSDYMATIGKRGGTSKSEKKAMAARINGKKGGRTTKDKSA